MCLRIIISYILKSLPLLIQRLHLPTGSDEAKLNTIKLISLQKKLHSLKNIKSMEQNFQRILIFEQENPKSICKGITIYTLIHLQPIS